MDRRLGHEAVWEGDIDDAGDEARAAEEEEIPVKATGFFEGELLCLRGYAGLVLCSGCD